MFKATIGAEAALRATILKTQTTVAANSKVFQGGEQIVDPYKKIVALTGEVRKNIDSIRVRSVELAGVTSNEVIEVFGITSSLVGQIGGGLKEAEDLAISFAAALGTFGLPLYQARQEIGSILRADITADSYLARSLGITNADIAKAKTQAGGVVKFLQDRLSTAVAGQRIAAQGLSGVTSNIKDIIELVAQSFGTGMLDPLIGGITTVYNGLASVRQVLMDIAKTSGTVIGSTAALFAGNIASQTTLAPEGAASTEFLQAAERQLSSFGARLKEVVASVSGQVTNLLDSLGTSFGILLKGLGDLAAGLISLKIENLKALVGVANVAAAGLRGVATAASGLLTIWGKLLENPVIQQISQITAGMHLLQTVGITPLIRSGFFLTNIIKSIASLAPIIIQQFNNVRAVIGSVIIALGRLVAQFGAIATTGANAWAPASKGLKALRDEILLVSKELTKVGVSAQNAGSKVGSLGRSVESAGGALRGLVFGFIKFQVQMALIAAAIAFVGERLGAFQEKQDRIASSQRAEQALRDLNTIYKDIGDSAAESDKRAAAFARTLVDAEYDKAVAGLEKVNKKLKDMQDLTESGGLGGALRRLAQGFNPENWDAFWKYQQRPLSKKDQLFSDFALEEQKKKQQEVIADLQKWQQKVNLEGLDKNIRIETENRTNLEKEIAEYRRAVDSTIFGKRQELAQKEVDIFRAAGELRIRQMEIANNKLLKGQEGASRAALEALNDYLVKRETGELAIEAAKRDLVIEVNNLEKQVADYRFEQEKKIAEIKRKLGEYETKVADYKLQQAKASAQAAAGASPEGGVAGSTGGGAAEFGLTGRTRMSDPNWAHAHFQTLTGTAKDLVDDVLPVLRKLLQDGIPVELAGGTMATNKMSDATLRSLLQRAIAMHTHSSDGRSLDFNVPKGTKVPAALSDIRDTRGNGGITGLLPGGRTFLAHLAPGAQATGGMPTIRQALQVVESEGYNVMFGGGTFSSYADHPRQLRRSGGSAKVPTFSDAAGRYQFLSSTWDPIAKKLGLKDFSPASQDRAAEYYARTKHGLSLDAPATDANMSKLSPTWAGFPQINNPGGFHGQAKKSFAQIRAEAANKPGGRAAVGSSAPTLTPLPPPQAPRFEDDGGSARFDALSRSISNASARLAELRKKLSEANTAEAFNNILTNLYPPVALEEFKNNIIRGEESLKLMRAIDTTQAFNQSTLNLEAEHLTELKVLERERTETLTGINSRLKAGQLTQAEYNKLTKQAIDLEKVHKKGLEDRNALKKQELTVTTAIATITELINRTAQINAEREGELAKQQFAFLSGAVPSRNDNPLLKARREAEFSIAQERAKLTRENKLSGPDEQLRFEEMAAATRETAEVLGGFAKQVEDYNKLLGLATGYADLITGGLRNLASSLINGGDIKESLQQFFKNLSDKALGDVLDYAFKPIQLKMEEIFKNLFGVPEPPEVVALDQNTAALNRLTSVLTTSGTTSFSTAFTDLGGTNTLDAFSSTFPPLIDLTLGLGDALGGATTAVSALPESMKGLQKGAGFLAEGLTAVGSIFSSLQQGGGAGGASGIVSGVTSILKMFTGAFGGGGASGLVGFDTPGLLAGGLSLASFRARGGPVLPGIPYIVGDNPDGSLNDTSELFVPTSAGRILSAKDTQSMMRVPFAATGGAGGAGGTGGAASAVSMGIPGTGGAGGAGGGAGAAGAGGAGGAGGAAGAGGAGGAALVIPFTKAGSSNGGAMSPAAMAEASAAVAAGMGAIDIRYDTVSVGGMDVVSTEQAQQIGRDAAQRGAAMALQVLQQSVGARKRIGI